MPFYEYVCEQCGHETELLQKVGAPVPAACEACDASAVRRKLSRIAFRLKGSGWYETDFKTGDDRRHLASGDSEAPAGAADGASAEAAEGAKGAKDAKGADAANAKEAKGAKGAEAAKGANGAAKTSDGAKTAESPSKPPPSGAKTSGADPSASA